MHCRARRRRSTWCCSGRTRRPGAELAELTAKQLVVAVATAALRAPTAGQDLAR